MDRSTHVVYVDFCGTNDRVARFLQYLIGVKGLAIQPTTLSATCCPAIVFRGVQIEGFWPIINHIWDVVRYPDLMPDTPGKRGLVMSFVEQLLLTDTCPTKFAELYTDNAKSGKFMGGKQTPNLLDLAVASSVAQGCKSMPPFIPPLIKALTTCMENVTFERDHPDVKHFINNVAEIIA